MNYDWNWFFSSFCQCAAALIGIIGAFVISRLLGHSEKVNSTISEFDNLRIQYNKLIASISKRKFYWLTENMVKYDIGLQASISNGDYEDLQQKEVNDKIFRERKDLYKVEDAVNKVFPYLFQKYSSKILEAKIKEGRIIGLSGLQESTNELDTQMLNEKEAINKLEVESKTLIQYFLHNQQDLNSFKDSINPLKVIIILLMIAFLLTVIYPLHFMPMYEKQDPSLIYNPIEILKNFSSLKSWMLVIFFFVINALFGYFLYLTYQLKSKLSKAIANNSDKYQNIKNYSEYFENE